MFGLSETRAKRARPAAGVAGVGARKKTHLGSGFCCSLSGRTCRHPGPHAPEKNYTVFLTHQLRNRASSAGSSPIQNLDLSSRRNWPSSAGNWGCRCQAALTSSLALKVSPPLGRPAPSAASVIEKNQKGFMHSVRAFSKESPKRGA